jgi:hypothetical protein
MCRKKGAVKYDDRIDALSQGVQWFIHSLAQSAHKAQAIRKNEMWKAMMDAFENHFDLFRFRGGPKYSISHHKGPIGITLTLSNAYCFYGPMYIDEAEWIVDP